MSKRRSIVDELRAAIRQAERREELSQRRRVLLVERPASPEPAGAGDDEPRGSNVKIDPTILKTIPPTRRRVMLLRWGCGLGQQQIAERVGISQQRVAQQLQAARRTFPQLPRLLPRSGRVRVGLPAQ